MQVMALRSQAAWLAFLIERLPGRVLQRRSMAEVFACTERAQSRSSSVPEFRKSSFGGLLLLMKIGNLSIIGIFGFSCKA